MRQTTEIISGSGKLNCRVNYYRNSHLNILYAGFNALKRNGLINLSYQHRTKPILEGKPIVEVIVNNELRIIYDTLDGFNWIPDSESANFEFFKRYFDADAYFKRSYHPMLTRISDLRIYPLGLYYRVDPEFELTFRNFYRHIKHKTRNTLLTRRILGLDRNDLTYREIASSPTPTGFNREPRILFYARLWDPTKGDTQEQKNEREKMNAHRIEIVKACKREFNRYFTGGIQQSSTTEHVDQSLLVSSKKLRREEYIKKVHTSSICIASQGLHQSIGAKFGEYVASSRAIVTEPLAFVPTGELREGTNYLSFHSISELLEKLEKLCSNSPEVENMMINNHNYYNNFLRPDQLVLNSLNTCIEIMQT